MFLVILSAFLYREAAIPAMYDFISYNEMLKSRGIVLKTPVKDTTGDKFSISEFDNLGAMKVRSGIAFSTGTSYIYFNKMYDGNGAYYVEGFRFINYKEGKEPDFIISARYAKIFEDFIYVVNPYYYEFSGRAVKTAKQIRGIKIIVLPYRPSGIFALSAVDVPESISLIKVFYYNDYVFNSGLSSPALSNIIFNRLGYYIILVLMLIICSTFGSAFKNMRSLNREYLQTAAFYLISFFMVSLCYDTLAQVVNMIYYLIT